MEMWGKGDDDGREVRKSIQMTFKQKRKDWSFRGCLLRYVNMSIRVKESNITSEKYREWRITQR